MKYSLFVTKREAEQLKPLFHNETIRRWLLACVEEQIKREERLVLDYIRNQAHGLATCPHDMILNGDLGVPVPDTLPNRVVRFDIPEAFLRNPRAPLTRYEGIAV